MWTIFLFKHEPLISAYATKLANLVQIETGKTLKTIKVDHNNFYLFLMYLKGVQSLALDFKFYNTQNLIF